MDLIAPKLAGKYCAFFRFVHGNNDRFGQKVWCDIMVKQQEPEPEMIKPKEEKVEELQKSFVIEEK
jgi:hypothetical protein